MSLRRRISVAAISAAALLGVAGGASADGRIGEAVLVQKDVLRVAGASSSPISVGDGVVRNETVRTGNDSAARLVMIDSTNLSLGANATLTLDRTVFNDETSYRDIAIRLGTGAFRFVTGHSEKTAYKINTPLATIGVRGTILDIRSQRGQTMVVLQEGASRVCTLTFQCLELTQPGDTAIITATGQGRSAIKKTGNPSWSFAATCASTSGLCTVTDLASNAPPQDFTGILCGR
ncbi:MULTISPECIES: FecR domain-containing protein [unclassified Bradyrhizobium]|uniref:FecR family protein n=1 Tax=unclassified Bradyrhizobium TaxID=2631580 RepID=UPI0028E6B8AC|nr:MULTISPECIES: FecR domain-containing protein [unclassified Bradyrhizobium]